MNNIPKYFDTAATTPIDKRVLDAMYPYFSEIFGNASSNHNYGKQAKEAIEKARIHTAKLINADINEIIFTSGATESINLALKGYVEANIDKGNHIITVKTEHKAVLATCEYLETKGIEVTYLDVDENGLMSLDDLISAIRNTTLLIAVMHVNNEIGVKQPITEIGKIANEHNICFFCDATQAVGKIEVDVEVDDIDMLCFSGHKLNGPKGIGVLFKKKKIDLIPLFHGGSQENGLRAGTYNTPLIVGLGKACELAKNELRNNTDLINKIHEYLIRELNKINGLVIIGQDELRLPNIINVMIPGFNFDVFISKHFDFALSNGSACTSQIIESSHVLKAMELNEVECSQCIRISFDKTVTEIQINELVNSIKTEINKY